MQRCITKISKKKRKIIYFYNQFFNEPLNHFNNIILYKKIFISKKHNYINEL